MVSNPKSIVNSSTYSKFFWGSEENGGSLQGSACRMRSSYHSLNKSNMNAYPLKKGKKKTVKFLKKKKKTWQNVSKFVPYCLVTLFSVKLNRNCYCHINLRECQPPYE